MIFYENKLLISPYIGDLKSLDVHERFFKLLEFFKQNYDLKFDAILCDKHPHFSYAKEFEERIKIFIIMRIFVRLILNTKKILQKMKRL